MRPQIDQRDTWILGINSAYHETAACLIKNGRVVAAAEEERFSRVRHGKPANLLNPHWLPEQSIRYCLTQAGIEAGDISHVGYSLVPEARREFNVGADSESEPWNAGTSGGENLFYDLLLLVPGKLSEILGEDIRDRFHWIEHHLCHAASAYFVSPFEDAAILSIDGIGEATSIWIGKGLQGRLEAIREIRYPNSLGFLWTKTSRFLGFGPYGQWKVMALAGYGNPDRYYGEFRRFVDFDANGFLTIDDGVLQFRLDSFAAFERLFGSARRPEEGIEDRHQDIAASLQRLTSEIVLALAQYAKEASGSRNLCYAGGVALNCVSNRLLLETGPFESVFIPPAANDAGTAMGACYHIWNQVLGRPRQYTLSHAYLGPEYSDAEIDAAVRECSVDGRAVEDFEATVARRIAGGEIVAWFDGRMEFGPRALGHRSILADPRRSDVRHRLNESVKHREFFRPFAASVLAERVAEWFEVGRPSASDGFMLFSRKIRPGRVGEIPAVCHIDGTSRIQCVDASTSPRFHRLISAFADITGVPLLLNTSLNDSEPIICTAQNAIDTCARAGIRWLAMQGRLFEVERWAGATAGDAARGWGSSAEFDPVTMVDATAAEMIELAVMGSAASATDSDGRGPAAATTAVAIPRRAEGLHKDVLEQPVKLAFRSR